MSHTVFRYDAIFFFVAERASIAAQYLAPVSEKQQS